MDKSKRFSGKHVMVTGAARGIGLEIARGFAREGAVLSLLDYNLDNLTAFVKELKADDREVYGYDVDVSNRKDVTDSVKKADAVRPIDALQHRSRGPRPINPPYLTGFRRLPRKGLEPQRPDMHAALGVRSQIIEPGHAVDFAQEHPLHVDHVAPGHHQPTIRV